MADHVDPWACPHDWAPKTHCRFCGVPAPCGAADSQGLQCRLYRGHDSHHGDGSGAIWDAR